MSNERKLTIAITGIFIMVNIGILVGSLSPLQISFLIGLETIIAFFIFLVGIVNA